jgi:alanine racemase
MIFGVTPAPHLTAGLRPTMTLRTQVAQLRTAKSGDPVGYSALYHARRDTRIATLPFGYDDGIPMSASRRGAVLIAGRRMPIAGQISMNYTTIDVGDSRVEIGDEVTFFGEGQGDERLTIEEAAEAAEILPYELLVRVGRRVPREFED